MYRTNTSDVKGVYYRKTRRKWIAQIMFRNKCYYLGGYDTIEDAARARREAEKQFLGTGFLKLRQKQIEAALYNTINIRK